MRKSSLVERQCHSLMRQFVHRVKVATLHTRQFGHRVKVATLQLTPLSVLRDNEKENHAYTLLLFQACGCNTLNIWEIFWHKISSNGHEI